MPLGEKGLQPTLGVNTLGIKDHFFGDMDPALSLLENSIHKRNYISWAK
jgi:hypothetical protein